MVTFPDGTRVRAVSLAERREDDPERAFGLYLDQHWALTWPAELVAWPDVGVPEEPEVAAVQVAAAFDRARRGELVEVGCLGGRGRTGTALACTAILAGVAPSKAVAGCAGRTGRRPSRRPSRKRGSNGSAAGPPTPLRPRGARVPPCPRSSTRPSAC
jgi:hypothetical protein